MTRLQVGDYELVSLIDTWGTLGNLEELYPRVPLAAWEPYRTLYPDLFRGDEWRPPFGCFLVRSADVVMVIDAGVGPAGGSFLPPSEGRLPEILASLDVSPAEVDLCVLTHLHIDHVGWATTGGRPTWPRARYVTSRNDWTWMESRDASERDRILDLLTPVARSGNLRLIDEEEALAPGVRLTHTPGHTPGHCSIRLSSNGSEAVILGDVAVHPAMLGHPDWSYLFDVDPDAAVATRRAVLDELRDREVAVACGHYPGGIGRLEAHEDRLVWRSLA
jgi:glyoxylase-like metal-dependent hydrolase (beta-lactamase superfamily II)